MIETRRSGEAASSVRKAVNLQAPPEVAWRVFTEKLGSWWPLMTYKIGKANAVDAVIEPRVGGRWYERGEDGSTCEWGRVLMWEPHTRLVEAWQPIKLLQFPRLGGRNCCPLSRS